MNSQVPREDPEEGDCEMRMALWRSEFRSRLNPIPVDVQPNQARLSLSIKVVASHRQKNPSGKSDYARFHTHRPHNGRSA